MQEVAVSPSSISSQEAPKLFRPCPANYLADQIHAAITFLERCRADQQYLPSRIMEGLTEYEFRKQLHLVALWKEGTWGRDVQGHIASATGELRSNIVSFLNVVAREISRVTGSGTTAAKVIELVKSAPADKIGFSRDDWDSTELRMSLWCDRFYRAQKSAQLQIEAKKAEWRRSGNNKGQVRYALSKHSNLYPQQGEVQASPQKQRCNRTRSKSARSEAGSATTLENPPGVDGVDAPAGTALCSQGAIPYTSEVPPGTVHNELNELKMPECVGRRRTRLLSRYAVPDRSRSSDRGSQRSASVQPSAAYESLALLNTVAQQIPSSSTEELRSRLQQNDPEAREELVKLGIRHLLIEARRIKYSLSQESTATLEDLVAWGTDGLLAAASRFDAERGVEFPLFARIMIRGAIIDGIRKFGNVVRLPRLCLERQSNASTTEAPDEQEFPQESSSALSAHRLPAHTRYFTWLDELLPDGQRLHEVLPDESASPPGEELIANERYSYFKAQLVEAMKDLSPQETRVITQYYNLSDQGSEKITQHQIAAEMQLTESRVSQIRLAAIKKLRSYFLPQTDERLEP